MRKGEWRERKEGGKGVNEFDAGWLLYLPGTGREAGAGTAGSLHFGRAFCRLLDVTPPLPSHRLANRGSALAASTPPRLASRSPPAEMWGNMHSCIQYNYKETSSRQIYMFPSAGRLESRAEKRWNSVTHACHRTEPEREMGIMFRPPARHPPSCCPWQTSTEAGQGRCGGRHHPG